MPADSFEGRFAGLLPPKPVDEKTWQMGKVLLEAMGVKVTPLKGWCERPAKSILKPPLHGLRSEAHQMTQFAKRETLLFTQRGDVTHVTSRIAGHVVEERLDSLVETVGS